MTKPRAPHRSIYVRAKFARLHRALDRKRAHDAITPAIHSAGIRVLTGNDLLYRNRRDLDALAGLFPLVRQDARDFQEALNADQQCGENR